MRHHLVIVREPYLKLLLSGKKKIECRLSTNRQPPYMAVTPGDLLWLKLPSRAIRAVATVGEVQFRTARCGAELTRWVRRFQKHIRAEDSFFDGADDRARYASLIGIESVIAIGPMPLYKTDQRAWVVLDKSPRPRMRIVERTPRAAKA